METSDIFAAKFERYSPERIKAIREALGMTQAEFANKFCLEEATIQGWEAPEGKKKHREHGGPAFFVLYYLESFALKKRNFAARIVRKFRQEKDDEFKELERRYEGTF